MPDRTLLTLTRLALGAMFLAACTVGDPNAQLPGDDDPVDAATVSPDAGGGGGGDGGGNANCEALVTPAPNGHHNPGTTCIAGGCHNGGTAGAPLFTVAGTLYTTAAGTAPKAGATIVLPAPGTGTPIKMVTASNGNFWLEGAAPLPTRPKASLCPTTVQMTSPAQDGNCNSCHGTGSRIALP